MVSSFPLVLPAFTFICRLLFNRVYLSSMLFCACSSVTIAIGIINAYTLVLCLYMCSYIVCASVVLVLVRFVHSVYRRRDRKF